MIEVKAASVGEALLTDEALMEALERLGCFVDVGLFPLGEPEPKDMIFEIARQGGWGVRRAGMTIDSSWAPFEQARALVAEHDFKGVEIVVVLGCGGGALPLSIAEAVEGQDVQVAVLEPDHALLIGALRREPRLLERAAKDRLVFFATLSALKMCIAFNFEDRGKVLVVCPPVSQRRHPEVARTLATEVEEAMALAAVSSNTVRLRASQWVNNLIENLPRRVDLPSLFCLAGAFAGVPAILVAAGPSLDKNIEQLRGVGDRALIVCVNTSLKALLKAGVTPHLVLCLEGLDVSTHFEGAEEALAQTALALDLTCHPKLFGLPAAPIFTFLGSNARNLDFVSRVLQEEEVEGLSMGGSVATAAFSCVDVLGCDPIVLVGQDLAYTGGQVYASGTVFEAMRMESTGCQGEMTDPDGAKQQILDASESPGTGTFCGARRLVPALAWGGKGEVMTSMDFNLFRAWFVAAGAQVHARRGARLINATEGGAEIGGFESLRLDAVIARWISPRAPLPIRDMLARIGEQAPRVSLDRWVVGIEAAVVDCRAVVRAARGARDKAREAAVRLEAAGVEGEGFAQAVEALGAAERAVMRRSAESPLVDGCVQAALLDLLDEAQDDEGWPVQARWRRQLELSAGLNEAILKAAQRLLGRLEAARGEARRRQG